MWFDSQAALKQLTGDDMPPTDPLTHVAQVAHVAGPHPPKSGASGASMMARTDTRTGAHEVFPAYKKADRHAPPLQSDVDTYLAALTLHGPMTYGAAVADLRSDGVTPVAQAHPRQPLHSAQHRGPESHARGRVLVSLLATLLSRPEPALRRLQAIAYRPTDRQRAAALERFVVARPVTGLAGGGCRSTHAAQLPRWIHETNPSKNLCNRARITKTTQPDKEVQKVA